MSKQLKLQKDKPTYHLWELQREKDKHPLVHDNITLEEAGKEKTTKLAHSTRFK